MDKSKIHDSEELKKLIKSRLCEDTEDFDVGYLDASSTNFVKIQTKEDMLGVKSTTTVKSHFGVMAYFGVVERVNLSM